VEALASLDDEMRRETPDLYRKLIVDRNQRWAHILAARLKVPEVEFVAVGAAHLAGPDSVQNALSQLGIKAVRQ
jgi:uncharacterized protein YbaP (TraB family)